MSKIPQPLGTKLLVLPIPRKESKTESGNLYIPETVNADLDEATVIKVSSEISHLVQENDVVLFSSKRGAGAYYAGKSHLWLTIEDIWGVLPKNPLAKAPENEQG